MPVQQYVISTPTGFQTASTNRLRNAMLNLNFQSRNDVRILNSIHEDGDKLAEMEEEAVQRLKAAYPGLVIEPNILYKNFRHPLLENFQELSVPASDTKTLTIHVVDSVTNNPLPQVTIYLIVDQSRQIGFKGITDPQGISRFTTRASMRRFDALVLLPATGYWNRILKSLVIMDDYQVGLSSLPSLQPEIYPWGHQFAQMQDGLGNGGAGVKIAVVDTGIRRDHPDLSPTGGRNCVYGENELLWYEDEDGHGSHCAGIIAAAANNTGVKGYVPQAQIYAYRVFAKDGAGATTYDIAKAIQSAVEDGCDIISLSLGSNTAQTSIRTKTELAYEKGVLCIAATGNDGGEVSYPAKFPLVLGVGAFGFFGSYPSDSLHYDNESQVHSTDSKYYMANFSNFGEGVDLCAPGVAILSTVPNGYSAWDGTSMACPQVTGMAALALASHLDILNAQRDAERVERLLQLLKSQAKPLGFGAIYEGGGCLNVLDLITPETSRI